MNVLVDTSVWSLALRRRRPVRSPQLLELVELTREGRVVVLGLIRQELLSGIRDRDQFDRLRMRLRAFPDLTLETADHEEAAIFYNRCRSRGVEGSTVDLLICAVAARRSLPILTTDSDFDAYSSHLPIQLHSPRELGDPSLRSG